METESFVASDVFETALLSGVWHVCALFPAIKSRMCEMQAY